MAEIFSKDIPQYEREGLDFLYELEKPANNLFFANFTNDSGADLYADTHFRIASIKVDSPSLTIDYNANKQPVIKTADMPTTVTITWVEDVYRSVEKFHTRWIQSWYDFRSDFLPVGVNGRFKNMELIGYHYKNVVESSSAVPLATTEPVLWLRLYGLVPQKTGPGYQYGWGEPGSATIDITYNCSSIEPYYYNRPNKNSEYLVGGVGDDLLSTGNNPQLGGSRYQGEPTVKPSSEYASKYTDLGGYEHLNSNTKMPYSSWAWTSLKNTDNKGTLLAGSAESMTSDK